MRTARTIGIKTDGTEVVIHGRNISLEVQKRTVNDIIANGVPKDYSAVEYQTSDGKLRTFHSGVCVADALKAAEKKAAEKLAHKPKPEPKTETKAEAPKASDKKPTIKP